MVVTNLNSFFLTSIKPQLDASRHQRMLKAMRWAGFAALFALLFNCGPTFAQTSFSVGGLCTIANWLKAAAGVVALIAVALYFINSVFAKSNMLGDIITNVFIGAVVVALGTTLIGYTGLTVNC